MSSTPCLVLFWNSKIGKSKTCCYFFQTISSLGQQDTLVSNMIGPQSSGSTLILLEKNVHNERGQEVSRYYSHGFCQKKFLNVQVYVEVELVSGTVSSPLDGNSLKRNSRILGFCFSFSCKRNCRTLVQSYSAILFFDKLLHCLFVTLPLLIRNLLERVIPIYILSNFVAIWS